MRVGLVFPKSIVGTNPVTKAERERVVDLIRDLANEIHERGSTYDHRDPSIPNSFQIGDIRTCRYDLCVESLAIIRDIEGATDTTVN